MTPFRTLRTAACERLSRREALAWIGGTTVGTLVFDPVKDAAREALFGAIEGTSPDPVPHLRLDLGVEAFHRLAADNQRAAWEGLKNAGSIPEHAAGRCTFVEERDGDMWVAHQGGEAAGILWGKPLIPGRMADQPDRAFGRWRAECIRAAVRRSEPTFELVRAVVNGRAHRYTALVVPGRTITVVTAPDQASPAPVARSTAPTTHRESV